MQFRKMRFSIKDDAASPASEDLNATPKAGLKTDPVDPERSEQWWDAQQRLLQYLHALEMPAEPSLKISLKAIRRAMADSHPIKNANPAGLAMRALRKVLAEERLDCLTHMMCAAGDDHPPGSPISPSSSSHRCAAIFGDAEMVLSTKGDLWTMPPLNRSAMRAEAIERSFLLRLAYRLLGKLKRTHH